MNEITLIKTTLLVSITNSILGFAFSDAFAVLGWFCVVMMSIRFIIDNRRK
jgi:hypothetical protein